ncbi:MAG TPA: enolase C-terminal domain-like protein [Bryobacteraceae bacterium]|nr:enolase C-terminal domain-like protein [Bryobacteraceae bacterium]
MRRRDLLAGAAAMPALAAQQYASRTRGLPRLTIKEVKVIPTSAGRGYQWVFVKVITSEPGLYGLGSASNVNAAFSVINLIEKHYAPFWVGKDPDRIEDLWQSTNVHAYWRNSMIHNNALSGLDMALWDIKGKRAGMPVYDLLGGKARDGVSLYAHADGRDMQQVEDNVRKYMEEGYRHVRAQMGGYGGGGMIAPGKGSRPASGFQGAVFDEDLYVDTIPKLFEHLRVKLGREVKLLHDVHEHLTPTMAVEFAKRMEPYHMFFVEDILPPEQIDWFREIKKVTTTPLAMGELFTSPREWVPLISERAIDFVRNRVSQTGGITAAKKTAALCEAFGVRTAWQEGGDNDPVNQLAAYHVDYSIASFGIQEENHFPPLVHEMMPGTAELKGGYLYGNDAPGLGIDINEATAAKFPLQPPPGGDTWTTVRGVDGGLVKP